MVSLWWLLPIVGTLNGIFGESLIDVRASNGELRPFAKLLLAFTPAGTRIRRQRLFSPSHARLQPSSAMTADVVEKTDSVDNAQTSAIARQDLKGVIKLFFHDKRYGFISCPEIETEYGSDAFVMASDMLTFRIGDEVKFDVEEREKNGRKLAKAKNLRIVTQSLAAREATVLADEATVNQLESSAAIAEVEELTGKFALGNAAGYEGDLRDKWENEEEPVFNLCADASDLDFKQRGRVVGRGGSNLLRITEQYGADFIWMDAQGKICIYGLAEKGVRYALREVLWTVLYERHEGKKAERAEKTTKITEDET